MSCPYPDPWFLPKGKTTVAKSDVVYVLPDQLQHSRILVISGY